MSEIAVIGAGAWGTSLAIVLGRKGTHRVRLWAHEAEVIESISRRRTNEKFLPGHLIPEAVAVSSELERVVEGAEILVSVMPSQHCRALFERMRPLLPPDILVISATKGLEEGSLLRMSEVIRLVLKRESAAIGALSGPSFAQEVARGDPTAITIASQDADLLRTVQQEFGDPRFRVYTNSDVVGVELGGALKNVIAVAAGILDGLGLGNNPRAALLTRGLAEITRVGVALGADAATFAGLAGMGDLILTATGGLSRNRALGIAVAQGETLDSWRARNRTVAEGANTSRAAAALASRAGVEMPIVDQVRAVLFDGKSAQDSLRDLMDREPKAEQWR